MSDLRLGVRLAIGGGRTSKTGVARLVLGTIGIGLAVAVLLVGASAGPVFQARNDRENAQVTLSGPISGVDPLYLRSSTTAYQDRQIDGNYVAASGAHAPLPPGLDRLPNDGEIVVSAALAKLLGSAEGAALRPRFPQKIIGTIGRQGVTDANALSFYAGDSGLDQSSAQAVYGFGWPLNREMPPNVVLLIAIGTVVLLVPVFVFIATSARIAGAERDRRLAALRLVGADARQARRIAAAESLASAGTGLVFGIGLFLLLRTLVGNFPILGVSPYPGDVTPPWPLALLIILVVPLLAVVTAQVALRRTIIEPLGVVRMGRATRRRLWWRLVPLVLGPMLLLSQGTVSYRPGWEGAVILGSAMLLLGIPALLPWLLERVVARMRGGRPATQLAIRRLQLDSGTPARVVAGVAVVLAGAIALDAVLASQTAKYDVPSFLRANASGDLVPAMTVAVEATQPEAVEASIRAVPGVRSALVVRTMYMNVGERGYNLAVVGCDALLRYGAVRSCTDGDVFSEGGHDVPGRGQTVELVDYAYRGPQPKNGTPWTVPDKLGESRYVSAFFGNGLLMVTPGALRGLQLPRGSAQIGVFTDPNRGDVVEGVRTAVGKYGWHARVDARGREYRPQTLQLFLTVRNGLLGGALFTLLLAGISMLVLALEQMRERRRPLAVLAASGVPTGTLARSLLWQTTLPVLLAVIVAVGAGIGLAGLVFRLISEPFAMEWGNVALYSGVAIVLVLVVTAMTLPTLRSATRLAALRTE